MIQAMRASILKAVTAVTVVAIAGEVAAAAAAAAEGQHVGDKALNKIHCNVNSQNTKQHNLRDCRWLTVLLVGLVLTQH
jgi:uncharacterized BrkB/YihY/UPF0761 family membrane protein